MTTNALLHKRPANQRGHTQIEWLDSWHTFSFADYDDPGHRSFRSLRVINDDRVAPGHGFPLHPHRDMEIISYIVSGELTHSDSMGHTRTVGPGQVQYMSAGTGVRHSEFNNSAAAPVHLLQIWITPNARNLQPAYAEWSPPLGSVSPLVPITSPDGADAGLTIHQDARIYVGTLAKDEAFTHPTRPERGLWLQMIAGDVVVEQEHLRAGDGLAVEGVSSCEIAAKNPARFLLFDLA
jgi:redox-sensitive bicupin YhaK (pirin superfamily)